MRIDEITRQYQCFLEQCRALAEAHEFSSLEECEEELEQLRAEMEKAWLELL